MTADSRFTLALPNAGGAQRATGAASAQEHSVHDLQNKAEALQAQVTDYQALLAKPLNEILNDREKALEAAAAWDAFGAMWMLSQRAMRRVALDLATQHGVSEAELVARAMQCANQVLNGDEEDLGGTIAPAQMAHIERHRPYLRKQFRQG